MIRLFKEGEDIGIPLQVGDILEVESGIFVKVKEIINESEEELAGIKKINVRIKGEVVSNGKPKLAKTRNSR